MKLIRFGPKGKEKPGVVQENGIIKDASGWIDDYDGDFFAGDGLETLKYELRSAKPESLDPSVRLGPPVKDPKIIPRTPSRTPDSKRWWARRSRR